MAEIKAFVAHSFNVEDKELIGIFVEHFDSLESSFPGFRWDHALQAEPTSVSSKVLAKIEDKNVFIGICTRSEYVIPPKAVVRIPLLKLVRLKGINIQWKTSDWIIQEIGLALGREMKVIIFIEEGVRRPGELFGDIEYIPFSRANPHASFDKLLQMLGTLAPKETIVSSVADAKSSISDKSKQTEEPEGNIEPQLDWDQARYNIAAFDAVVFAHDARRFDTIDAAYRASPFGKGVALTIWEARIEFLRMLGQQKFDFEKIKRAAYDNPANSQLLSFLASGYREFGDHQAAARAFEDAAADAESDSEKLRYLASAASEYAEAEQPHLSKKIVEKLKHAIADKPDLKYSLLSGLKYIAQAEKNSDLQLAVMEQIIELRPSDTSVRFELAFKHSDVGNSDMALYHYLKIPAFERDAITWNNLGVAYGNFQMPIKAIEAFRASANRNETLAMCNLGFKLLRSGLLTEAQIEADRALSIKPHHKSVPELLKRLNETPEEEENKLREALERTKVKAAFYRRIGEGILKTAAQAIASTWNSPEGVLEGKIDGAFVRIFGASEKPASALPGLLFRQGTVTHRIEYAGQVYGNVIFGSVKRSRDGEVTSVLASMNDNVKVVMVFNEDYSEISVMESPDSLHSQFYTLTRFS